MVALGVLAASRAWSAEAPDWLIEAARTPTPADAGKAAVVVLLHEQEVTLAENGVARVVERRAVRVLGREGVGECVGAVHYRTDGGKVLDLRGWLIRGS